MIVIRADANKEIGMGHIMRCLSIADAASSLGREIMFVLADNSVKKLVNQRGYDAVILNSDYRIMDEELIAWPNNEIECIIVDSYYVTTGYLYALRKVAMVVYIDDLAAFSYPVDCLINYNAYSLEIDYQSLYDSNPPKLILGPKYAPLRKMFIGIKKRYQNIKITDVLVSTGGTDPCHIALSIVESKPKGFTFHILLGAMNADKATIKKLSNDMENIIIHENESDMRSLILSCDIAVSAAGSTLYEICACGVPVITYIMADNQISGANAFEKMGLAVNIGDMRREKEVAKRVIHAVKDLDNDYNRRIKIGQRMQNLVDGFGAERIVKEVLNASQEIVIENDR